MQGWKDSLRDPKHARFKREAKGAAQNAGIAPGKARERLRGSRGRPFLPPSPEPAPVPLPSEPPALHPLAPGSADAIPGISGIPHLPPAGRSQTRWRLRAPLAASPRSVSSPRLSQFPDSRFPAWGDPERLWESSGCSQPCPALPAGVEREHASIPLPLSITPAYCSLFLFISRRKLM